MKKVIAVIIALAAISAEAKNSSSKTLENALKVMPIGHWIGKGPGDGYDKCIIKITAFEQGERSKIRVQGIEYYEGKISYEFDFEFTAKKEINLDINHTDDGEMDIELASSVDASTVDEELNHVESISLNLDQSENLTRVSLSDILINQHSDPSENTMFCKNLKLLTK